MSDDDKQLRWPALRLKPSLFRRLHAMAQRKGLIPMKTERGQNAAKLGAMELIDYLLTKEEQREKRRKEKGQADE